MVTYSPYKDVEAAFYKMLATTFKNVALPSGKLIAKPSVTGAGRAEFDEFKSDFSLAGKRAVVDAMLKMQNALLNLPELKNP